MIRFRPIWLMTAFTLVALAILVMLGRWQWERYNEKLAAAAAPVPEMTIANYQPIEDGIQFVYGLRPDTHEQGWRVFTPVQYGDTIVFVDSDFIVGPQAPNPSEVRISPALKLGGPIRGASVRPDPAPPLAAALSPPRPLQRLWFDIDLQAMSRNAGLNNTADYYLTGTYVAADGRAMANPFAHGPGVDQLPPARHLGYALTWYGLALVLLVIYLAYHISTARLSFAPPRPPEE